VKKRRRQIPKNRAVIYCRVSTEEQAHNLSIPVQEQRCIAHCSYNGWEVAEVFSDLGQSAKTTDRVEFQRMLRYCQDPANGIGYVVVNDLSRFSRNTNDLIETRARLHIANVLVRSVAETIDESSTGNFMTTIFGAVHQLDNERRGERTKQGMQAAANLGRWPHQAPLGYLNHKPVGDGPNVSLDPTRSRLLQQAFELAATGMHTQAEILRIVTNLGLTTLKGRPVTMQTFQKLLINPFYTGWMRFSDRDDLVRGSYQPLITQDLFGKVLDVLEGRRPKLTGYSKNHPDFPLRVFVRCGKCGVPITGSYSTNRRGARYPYYRCRANCKAVKPIPGLLHMTFIEWLRELTPCPEAIPEIKDTSRRVWKERQGDAEEMRSVLNRKLSELVTRKNTLFDRWMQNKVDHATYEENSKRYTAEIDLVRAELRGTELEDLELEKVLDFAERIILRPDRLWVESSLEQRQRLQRTLFPDGIEYDGEKFGTARTPLFFRLLEADSEVGSSLASPTGFEPVLSP
jgi:site-specific DNA recombinase